MSSVNFDIPSAEDRRLIQIIARRAVRLYRELGNPRDQLDIEMDLRATHANGCPLDFAKLAAFDDFNFSHDIGGIATHLDRSNGQLTRHFLPRCSARRS